MCRLKEAYVDSMQSLKYLQDAVAEETGKPMEDFENAYLAENSMSSKNNARLITANERGTRMMETTRVDCAKESEFLQIRPPPNC